MDKTLTMTMLLDFYGELLTEKQRRYFDMYHNEDLSLSEIAELEGISRQGVWDQIGLIRRFEELRRTLEALERGLAALEADTTGETREQVRALLALLQPELPER